VFPMRYDLNSCIVVRKHSVLKGNADIAFTLLDSNSEKLRNILT
jgi:hypothetical protein